MKSKKIIENQLAIYKARIREYGDSPKSTYNQFLEIQNLRFERLLFHIDLNVEKESIHDVGCGICDMYNYLKKHDSKLEYSGTDIVPEMREMVKNKYPEIKFFLRDIIEDEIVESYDYVVLSGTFNLPGIVNHKVWRKFTRDMIFSMYKICKKGIAFNFLSNKADFYNPKMYYESLEDITNFCSQRLSRHIFIDHAYPLYEFSCTVLKPEAVKERYTDKTFNKYFKKK